MSGQDVNLLFLGDSNMAGRGLEPYTIVSNNVFIRTPLSAYNDWQNIVYPMWIDPRLVYDPKGSIHGAIGNYLQQYFGTIGFIGEAWGGSVTSEWQLGEPYFNRWSNFVVSAQQAENITFDALIMIFHDYSSISWDDATGYYNKTSAIINNVRDCINQPDLPVINIFTNNANNGELGTNNLEKAVDVHYDLALLDNIYNFSHGTVQEKFFKNDHYNMTGLEELGQQIGWHIKTLLDGNPVNSCKFNSVEYVGDHVFRAEVLNVNNYELKPQRPSDIKYFDTSGIEIKSINTTVSGNYVYSYLDLDDVALPNTFTFRHQSGDFPEGCQYLHFENDNIKIPVDKTGLVFETNNKVVLTTYDKEQQSVEVEHIKRNLRRGF